MKHAILITAYKDIEQLIELVGCFGSEARVFIHFDRKRRVPAALLERLLELPTVKFLSRRYAVNWGSTNHLRSILELARVAVKDADLSYLHLITGSDHPLRPSHEFTAFFERHRGSEFLDHFPLPTQYWLNGGWSRMTYYHPLDLIDIRKPGMRTLVNMLLRAQKRLGIRRPTDDLPSLHGGSTWWSLTRACVAHVLDYCDHEPAYLRRFKHTLCSEEIFFQTLIMNSPFARNVVNDNLRYIDWNLRNGNYPAVLDITDMDKVLSSGKLFARKLESPISDGLHEELRKRVCAADAALNR